MKTIEFGSTGIQVSRMGFGAMHLSIDGRPEERAAAAALHAVFDSGVTFIDTADCYCLNDKDMHHNERLIAGALKEYGADRSRILVGTKGGVIRPGGGWVPDGNPKRLRQTIRESHAALGGDAPIFLWQHHAPDARCPVAASLEPAAEAVEQGLIRFVGVSNYSPLQLQEAQSVVPIASVQNQFNFWRRESETNGMLFSCEEQRITFLPWGPIGGRGRARTLGELAPVREAAAAHAASPAAMVLAWVLHKSAAMLPIPGARSAMHFEECLRAMEISLSAEEFMRLESLS